MSHLNQKVLQLQHICCRVPKTGGGTLTPRRRSSDHRLQLLDGTQQWTVQLIGFQILPPSFQGNLLTLLLAETSPS